MRNLTLPWQLRRTTKAERKDYLFVHDLMMLNLGKGYYRYDDIIPLGGTPRAMPVVDHS